ncbi:MAG: hypothetical protein MK198_09640 [Gracilimonas sp.]|uniref:hypothetical protein n=1 Tax=Gracilimonas sp. TaxID=1974203 RepID=UPI003752B50C|nr:hypothetical protein [Gracilimonas sp.]
MKTLKIIILITSLMAVNACSSMQPLEVKFQKIEGDGFYTTSAATKSTIVREKNDQQIICSEPAPDATFNEQDNASLGLSLLHIGDKTNEAVSEGETEGGLGGRSVNVLLTREMYYRMCEFFANTNLDDSLKVQIYDQTLAYILKLNETNFGIGTGSGSTSQGIFNENNSLPGIPADTTAAQSNDDGSDNSDNNSDDEGW